MEMLEFYALSILVGVVLAVSLGLLGIHLVIRQKSLETLMIGQTMQLGIIVGAFASSILWHEAKIIHEGHIGVLISLGLAGFIYFLHGHLSKKWYQLKTELALIAIILSIAMTHVLTALNPLIESHFVRSFVGDIVTASQGENYFLIIVGVLSLIYFLGFRRKLFEDSLDLGLYGDLGHKRVYGFEFVLFLTMGLSIHVFGLMFTLACLLVPTILMSLSKSISYKNLILNIVIGNSLAVMGGFLLNIQFENLPTSPSIVILLSLIFSLRLILADLGNRVS
jgi:zinc transport system permease protein